MAAIVPTATTIISHGNRIEIVGTFGNAVGATDVWTTGLANVNYVIITDAAAGGITGGATISGGTVTFALSGSLAVNARVVAVGT